MYACGTRCVLFLADADILQDQTHLAWVIAERVGNPFRALNMTSMHWFMHACWVFFKVRTIRFHGNSWRTQKGRIIIWWSYIAANSWIIAKSLSSAENISDFAVLNKHSLPVESLRWWRAHIPLKHVHASARPLWGGGGIEHWGFRNPTGKTHEIQLYYM